MAHGFFQTRRTVRIDATGRCFILFADNPASADWTMFRHSERTPVVALPGDAHDFRNHVAAALDQHFVAGFDAQPGDFILVVQRGPRHGDAANRYRPEVSYRRQGPGP